MGLDQYAFKIKKGKIKSAMPHPDSINGDDLKEISYWRKHPNLQGWMHKLYEQRGGEEIFNCVMIQLTLEDLERLEADVFQGNLPQTEGFFYGNPADEHYKEKDLLFIQNAKLWIEDGYDILYDSWW